MITIISGVPGSGKTSLIVEMILEELKEQRKVFTIGIPDLILPVQKAGHPHHWHDSSWLKIDKFDPVQANKLGLESQWLPAECPTTCQFLTTCKRKPTPPDAGSLIVIDEAHAFFPQRPSGKAPPAFVEALNVHRHQGLDFWFISQRPSFLDPFVRGLSSRHIHVQLNPFSFTGGRNKYEWTEYQESVTATSKALASKTSYKPAPHVFALYKSASVHTVLEQKMPSIMKALLFMFFVLAIFVFMIYQRFDTHRQQVNELNAPPPIASQQLAQTAPQPVFTSPSTPTVIMPTEEAQPLVKTDLTDSESSQLQCIEMHNDCRCYYQTHRVDVPLIVCRSALGQGAAPLEQITKNLQVADNFTRLERTAGVGGGGADTAHTADSNDD